jgi:hypothetical protein
MGPYFQSAKGGDPLSPFLFNSVVQCLTKMVVKAQSNGLVVGLAPDLIENGVAITQYTDDTILSISHDFAKLKASHVPFRAHVWVKNKLPKK